MRICYLDSCFAFERESTRQAMAHTADDAVGLHPEHMPAPRHNTDWMKWGDERHEVSTRHDAHQVSGVNQGAPQQQLEGQALRDQSWQQPGRQPSGMRPRLAGHVKYHRPQKHPERYPAGTTTSCRTTRCTKNKAPLGRDRHRPPHPKLSSHRGILQVNKREHVKHHRPSTQTWPTWNALYRGDHVQYHRLPWRLSKKVYSPPHHRLQHQRHQ